MISVVLEKCSSVVVFSISFPRLSFAAIILPHYLDSSECLKNLFFLSFFPMSVSRSFDLFVEFRWSFFEILSKSLEWFQTSHYSFSGFTPWFSDLMIINSRIPKNLRKSQSISFVLRHSFPFPLHLELKGKRVKLNSKQTNGTHFELQFAVLDKFIHFHSFHLFQSENLTHISDNITRWLVHPVPEINQIHSRIELIWFHFISPRLANLDVFFPSEFIQSASYWDA